MPFTTVGWTTTQSSATLAYVAAIADQHLATSGNDIYVPALRNLVGTYAQGATLLYARLVSPSLRAVVPIDISPVDAAAVPVSRAPFIDMLDSPIPLDINEALNAQIANGGAEYDRVFAWLASGPITPVTGKIFSVTATSATTLVINTWTLCALTFPSTLPAARYQIVGMRAEGATIVAARLVIPSYAWRPGCIGASGATKTDNPQFRMGGMGVWGEFDSRQPPQVECCATTADTAQRITLDLIKL